MEHHKREWHRLTIEELTDQLKTDIENGLSEAQVKSAQLQFGKNSISTKKQQSALIRFLLQFHQPLIYILLASTLITLLLKEYTDATVIFAVVLINSLIGYIQETKALKAIDALSKSMNITATVIREGRQFEIDSIELVPGDLVVLHAGDQVPADLRLIKVRDLQVDESALTGESVAVQKNVGIGEKDAMIGDRLNMCYAATMVTYGAGLGIVTNTGDETEVGNINTSISSAEELDTPLTIKIKKFSHTLLWVILIFSIIILVAGYLQGGSLTDSFMVAVALMVGAIPEGLPAAVSIMLALGVSKMAKRRAIIRKLVAVETLGSTNVICSDKTGTLTENQMTVRAIMAGAELYEVTGTGYKPDGEVLLNGENVVMDEKPSLQMLLLGGLLCNNSRIEDADGRMIVEGDPTEAALISVAQKAGFSLEAVEQEYPRRDEIPFESAYQYMATLNQGREQTIFLKGSVEAVLAASNLMLNAQGEAVPIDKSFIQKSAEKMASEGLRVLAFAIKVVDDSEQALKHADVAKEMVFTGLQGMIDPPRQEASEAIRLCQQAGIQVKMITGDHALTAVNIAEQLGIEGKKEHGNLVSLSGPALKKISDEEILTLAEEVAVFARVSPDQKLRLVKALQTTGKVVAMTGDGVNDGPALKQANIGVAMGITGTEVAKDAADMVLTDDHFASIEAAVEEGRAVLDNLTKFIVWTLPTNLGEALVILASIALSTQLPLTPVQILWVNMTTSVFLGLMLSFEPKEPGIMTRPPQPANKPILTFPLIMRTLLVGSIIMLSAFYLFQFELAQGASLAKAQTVVTTAFIVLESFYLFNCRSLRRSVTEIGWFSNKWVYVGVLAMLALQLLFIQTPLMHNLFSSAPIGWDSWMRIIAAGFILFIIVYVEKIIRIKLLGQEEY